MLVHLLYLFICLNGVLRHRQEYFGSFRIVHHVRRKLGSGLRETGQWPKGNPLPAGRCWEPSVQLSARQLLTITGLELIIPDAPHHSLNYRFYNTKKKHLFEYFKSPNLWFVSIICNHRTKYVLFTDLTGRSDKCWSWILWINVNIANSIQGHSLKNSPSLCDQSYCGIKDLNIAVEESPTHPNGRPTVMNMLLADISTCTQTLRQKVTIMLQIKDKKNY